MDAREGISKIVFPFITLANIYGYIKLNPTTRIKLLDSLDSVLSLEECEHLTLSVIVFRMWALYHRSLSLGYQDQDSVEGKCLLSQLVPLREGQPDQTITFRPWFTIKPAPYKIQSKNWGLFLHDFENQIKPEVCNCIAYHNLKGSSFADTILVTKPAIFIQEKSLLTSNRNVANNLSPSMLELGLLKRERLKCSSIPNHIFIFSTDAKKRPETDQNLQMNEVLISFENQRAVFGDLLTFRNYFA